MALAPTRASKHRTVAAQSSAVPETGPAVRAAERRAGAPAGAGPSEGEHLDLNRTSLQLEDGLVMVLGPHGDPVPPTAFSAAAAAQPDAHLELPDGVRVPASRIAKVLTAQARGPLAETKAEAEAWLRAMLGIGTQPEAASPKDLNAEAAKDGPELTLFGDELVISTPAGASFVITTVKADQAPSEILAVLQPDDARIGADALWAHLRREAAAPSPEAAAPAGRFGRKQVAAPVPLTGCALRLEDDTLTLSTPWGDRFRLVPARWQPSDPPALGICRPDGEPVGVGQLVEALAFTGPDGSAGPTDGPAISSATPAPNPIPSEPPGRADQQPTRETTADALSGTTKEPVRACADGPAPDQTDGRHALVAAEDGRCDLGIMAGAAAELDSPILKVTLAGLPPGFSLSAGIDLGEGRWSLTAGDLYDLFLYAPPGAADAFDLDVTFSTPTGETSVVLKLALASPAAPEEAAVPCEASVFVLDPADDALEPPSPDQRSGTAERAAVPPLGSDAAPDAGPEAIAAGHALAHPGNPQPHELAASATSLPLPEPPGAGHDVSEMAQALSPPAEEDASLAAVSSIGSLEHDDDAAAPEPPPDGRVEPTSDADRTPQADGMPSDPASPAAASTDQSGIGTDGPAADQRPDLTVSAEAVPQPSPALASSRRVPLAIDSPTIEESAALPTLILISGVPHGASLSAGFDNGDGTWTVSPSDIGDLTLELAAEVPTTFALSANAVSVHRDGSISAVSREVRIGPETASGSAARTIRPDADGVSLDLCEIVREMAGDGTVQAVVIRALPPGTALSGGTYDPRIASWIVRPDQLRDLRLTGTISNARPATLRVTAAVVDRATGRSGASTRTIEIDQRLEPLASCPARMRVGGVGFWRPLSERRA